MENTILAWLLLKLVWRMWPIYVATVKRTNTCSLRCTCPSQTLGHPQWDDCRIEKHSRTYYLTWLVAEPHTQFILTGLQIAQHHSSLGIREIRELRTKVDLSFWYMVLPRMGWQFLLEEGLLQGSPLLGTYRKTWIAWVRDIWAKLEEKEIQKVLSKALLVGADNLETLAEVWFMNIRQVIIFASRNSPME